GYTGQYTLTNTGGAVVHGWTLAFDLPNGARISSLWEGVPTVDGTHVTVRNESWNADLDAGGSVIVGFVVDETRDTGDPTGCTINGAACAQGPTPTPSSSPTGSPTPTTSPTASPTPGPTTPTPSPTTTPTPTPTGSIPPAPGGTAAFAPYVDGS